MGPQAWNGIRILLLLTCVAACGAGQNSTQVEDSCTQQMSISKQIREQSGIAENVKALALAQHVVANAECFSAEAVANSRLLISANIQTPSN